MILIDGICIDLWKRLALRIFEQVCGICMIPICMLYRFQITINDPIISMKSSPLQIYDQLCGTTDVRPLSGLAVAKQFPRVQACRS